MLGSCVPLGAGLFALYVTGYSVFRIFEESLRVDPSEHFLGLRLNTCVASILTLVGAAVVADSSPQLEAVPFTTVERVLALALAGCRFRPSPPPLPAGRGRLHQSFTRAPVMASHQPAMLEA